MSCHRFRLPATSRLILPILLAGPNPGPARMRIKSTYR